MGSAQISIQQFTITIPSGQTQAVYTGIKRAAMIGVFLMKTEDVFYEPIVISVYDNGGIEARTISKVSVTQSRTYNVQVAYLSSLNV